MRFLVAAVHDGQRGCVVRSRFTHCLILLCTVIPIAVPAQEPDHTLSTTVSEVSLDVAVRDNKGQIIRDLRPEEIQVLENGVPQKVKHFAFVGGQSTVAQPEAASVPEQTAIVIGGNTQTVNTQKLRDIDVVSIVVEQLTPYDRSTLSKVVGDFLKDELRPNTYVGVFFLDQNLRVVQPYTNDAQSISAAIEKVVRRPNPKEFRWVTEQPNLFSGPLIGPASIYAQLAGMNFAAELRDAYDSSARQLQAIRSLIQVQAEIPGRKLILVATDGIMVHPDTLEALKVCISTANRANVTITGLNTDGFRYNQTTAGKRLLDIAANASQRRQLAAGAGGDQVVTADEVTASEMVESSMHADTVGQFELLTESTGGNVMMGNLRERLRKTMENVRTHYELTYSPSNTTTDGGFRNIEVKVSRPGAIVFTRNGYYALPLLNGRPIYPFEMATMKALDTQPQLHQFDFHAGTLQFRPGLKMDLAFVFEVPSKELSITHDKQWAKVHVCVTALIKNDEGEVVDKISKDIPYDVPVAKLPELQRGVVSFTAPFRLAPGRYTLETAAVDRQSMKASVRRSVLVVGEAPGLAMSELTLVRRVDAVADAEDSLDPLQARGAKITPELSDTISPRTGEQVSFFAVAYPAAPIDAPIKATLEIRRDGKTVLHTAGTQVPPDETGRASILVGVPAERLTPGQYEAQVSFEYKGQRASRATTFMVASNP